MFMPPVFPAHWHVSQPVLIADTFSSLVWKVSLPDGTPAIVKGLKPIEDIADELRGADYLVWRNGRGAVRLLGRENNLMLLEYAGERMLSHIVAEHGDYQATEIAAELMAKLYAASEEPGAANMFYDPADRDDLCLDPRRIAQMADAFSRALDVDPRRLLDQAYAYGCLSAAWNADGEEEQRDLAIAAAIKQVRQTSY
ncbi:hypothetical protein I3A56_22775 [Salmonella enterica]|nr:hypothetical protein [Salmonella enterica]